MPSFRHSQHSFSRGVWAPFLWYRSDLQDFARALRDAVNMVQISAGAVIRRPGSRNIAAVQTHTKQARLFPFVFSSDDAMMIEAGDRYFRFFRNGAQVLSGGVPYEVSSPYLEAGLPSLYIDGTGDTIFIASPNNHPRKLIRNAEADWEMELVDASTGPRFERRSQSITLELNLVSVGNGRRVTASKPMFSTSLSVNRIFRVMGGWIRITSVQSATLARATVFDDTPAVALTPSVDWTGPWEPADPAAPSYNLTATAGDAGDEITLTDSLAGGTLSSNVAIGDILDINATGAAYGRFALVTSIVDANTIKGIVLKASTTATTYSGSSRYEYELQAEVPQISASATTGTGITLTATGDVFDALHAPSGPTINDEPGAYFWLHGGLVRITQYLGPTTALADVIETLDIANVPTPIWEESAWSRYRGYPWTVAFHSGRVVWAGSSGLPSVFQTSHVADFEEYDISEALDNESIVYDIGTDRIQALASANGLVLFTSSGVYRAFGSSGPITPTDITANPQAAYGASHVKPMRIGDSILFVQASGRKIREIRWDETRAGFIAADLAFLANHLFEDATIVEWAYEAEPYSILWVVLSDGTLLSFTYQPENDVAGWMPHAIGSDGIVESIASIPYNGAYQTWLIVRRGSGGAAKRYVEVLDWDCLTDSCKRFTGPITTLTGLSHLEGLSVQTRRDEADGGDATVSGGQVTLESQAGSTAEAGLAYDGGSSVTPMPPNGKDFLGDILGRKITLHEIFCFVVESLGGKIDIASSTGIKSCPFPYRTGGEPADTAPVPATRGFRMGPIGKTGVIGGDAPTVTVYENRPVPLQIASIIQRYSVDD